MKQKLFILMISNLIFISVFAQKQIMLSPNQPVSYKIEMLQSDANETTLQLRLFSFFLEETKVSNSITTYRVTAEKATPILEKNAPDLPKYTRSVIISDTKKMQFEIISTKYKEFNNIPIALSEGRKKRFGKLTTQTNAAAENEITAKFFPEEVATLRSPYILGDKRGQTIVFYPFQYHSKAQTLRVYTDITLKIKPTDSICENPVCKKSKGTPSAFLQNLYKQHFVNYRYNKRYTPINENGNMLIVCHPDFTEALTEFVAWKMQTGLHTELVETTETGYSADHIKQYVENYYYDKGLTYLLLIGDAEHIPPLYKNGDSDAAYGHIAGNDSYAEVIVGRFSGETLTDIQTQVRRSIDYEKNPLPNDNWYKRCLLIASQEGPGDDEEFDYEHSRNIRDELLNYLYTHCNELYDGSHGELDAPGNPTSQMVTDAVNQGCGIINYTGHGEVDRYTTTGFNILDINNLENTGKLPFIFNIACLNGDFRGRTCFAEAWLRARHNDAPSGAVAIVASTIDQDWNPPMAANDEMIDILTEKYTDNIKRTFGGIALNGCMLMNDEYGTIGYEMTNTWVIFGDPSLRIRTDTPRETEVSHDAVVHTGAGSLTIDCAISNANACLMQNGEIIATKVLNQGLNTLTFKPAVTPLNLTVTAYNTIPYIAEIPVIQGDEPFIAIHTFTVSDVQGNNNQKPDYGETIALNLNLKNFGGQNSDVLNLQLSTSSPFATITECCLTTTGVSVNQIIELQNVFQIKIDENISTKTGIPVNLFISEQNTDNTWYQNITLKANAPVVDIKLVEIIDDRGNNNKLLDPGEQATLLFKISNKGDATLLQSHIQLSTTSQYVDMLTSEQSINAMEPNSSEIFSFCIDIQDDTPIGSRIFMNAVCVNSNGNTQKQIIVSQKIGLIRETWESNSFTTHQWEHGNMYYWTLTDAFAYEGKYSVRSGRIENGFTSELLLDVYVFQDDSISFFKKVSSEPDFDFLQFYVDDNLREQWSGEIDWSREVFHVSAGQHTFRWVYSKDEMMSNGYDAAWIDNIILPTYDQSGNHPPTFKTQPVLSVNSNEKYEYQIIVTDKNTDDNLTMSCIEKPDWLIFSLLNDTAAVLEGTPSSENYGFHSVKIVVNDGIATTHQTFRIGVGFQIEDFESGALTTLDWLGGNNPWQITSNVSFEKKFAMRSKPISDSQSSVIELQLFFLQDAEFSFYKKISSEESYDFLIFSIDDVEQARWSGEKGWTNEVFSIKKGKHKLKWTYKKDDINSTGEDCAWIDYLVLPDFTSIPRFTSRPVQMLQHGNIYSYEITVYDADQTDNLIIECPEKPNWLTFTQNQPFKAVMYGIPPDTAYGYYDVKLTVSDDVSQNIQNFSIGVNLLLEDWESQNFDAFNWSTYGSSAWHFTQQTAYEKNTALQSGNIQNNQKSELQISVNALIDDKISFYKKVSSEQNYDYLKFFMDGNLLAEWSGESDWSYEQFDVSKGLHTFLWRYEKDHWESDGQDCAWLDYISLPYHHTTPYFISAPDTIALINELYEYNIVIDCKSGIKDIEVTCIQKPDWLYFNRWSNNTAQLSGVPQYVDSGKYTVKLKVEHNETGEQTLQEYVLHVGSFTSLTSEEFEQMPLFNIFPNPADECIYLKFDSVNSNKNYLTIYNATGDLIKHIEIERTGYHVSPLQYTFNTKDWIQGIYFFRLQNSNQIQVKKCIITH